ncbi:MAG TPA: DUF362 domain-containing protein [Syntrophomonadaceae bacterium]|nr:DUF362 domain-containing protein [Syntrophomonadaceae bacterium]
MIKIKSSQAQVAIIKCDSYDYSAVKEAVRQGLELIGFRDLFQPGEKIILKPNLLAGDPPEKCVTTHPAVFRAAAEILQETGILLSFGDSPAMSSPESTARKAGILEAAEDLGLPLADFQHGQKVDYPQGSQIKKFTIARGVVESDGIVSLPKFKTHALTLITGAIKNQFGCIPGALKSEFHIRLPFIDGFARMLVDLNLLIKPRLYIMDAIMAMDGNGPRRGRPFKLGVLLFSTDPVAIDATACRLIGLKPETVDFIKYGQSNGLGYYESDHIKLLGDFEKSPIFSNFIKVSMPATMPFRAKWIQNSISPKPQIDADMCVKCGVCIKMCPLNPPAVNWPDGDENMPPMHGYDRCIRCFCCQELCPEGAVKLHVPLLARIFRPR